MQDNNYNQYNSYNQNGMPMYGNDMQSQMMNQGMQPQMQNQMYNPTMQQQPMYGGEMPQMYNQGMTQPTYGNNMQPQMMNQGMQSLQQQPMYGSEMQPQMYNQGMTQPMYGSEMPQMYNSDMQSQMMNQGMMGGQMMNQEMGQIENTATQQQPVEEIEPTQEIVDESVLKRNMKQLQMSDLVENDRPEEDYICEYIGNNGNKIIRRKFNFCAFFFGYAYFFYRKQYILGIADIALYYIIPMMLKNMGYAAMWIGIFVFSIVFGIIFNPIYVSIARRTVKKVKAANPGEDYYGVCSILAKKGGTKFLYFFLGLILFSVPQFLGIQNPFMTIDVSGFNKLGGIGTSNGIGGSGGVTYTYNPEDGIIMYDTSDISNTYSFTIPEKYELDTTSVINKEYVYSFNSDGSKCDSGGCNKCMVSVNAVGWNNGASDFASRRGSNFSANPSEQQINNVTWYKLEFESFGHTLEYFADYNNKIYYVLFEESNNGICKSDFDNMINSFRFN